MTSKYLFTVFTPTYNRAHTISRVHESLSRQTFRDFEWLVVDDGSTDDTAALVASWQGGDFPIRYIRQENRGKHTAFNRGVAEARGEFFLSVDSDDSFVPNALERFRWHWDGIPPELRDRFVGVTALCADQDGSLIGSRFPRDVLDSDSNEIRYRYGVTGDKWGFQRVDILREFPFPEVDETRFVPESVVWSAIARKYRTRYVNDVLHTYWQSSTPGAQISTTGVSPVRAAGIAMWLRIVLNNDLRWFTWAPLKFLHLGANYSRFSFASGIGLVEQRRRLNAVAQVLWVASLPVGIAASLWDRARNAHSGVAKQDADRGARGRDKN